jgi:hypothetical protein
MKISGFTIIKNAVINDYPIVEAISSILDVVHEMVVLVGDSKDDTKQLIESIGSEKIKIYDSIWDKNLRKGGEVLAVETNKAFQLIDPQSTWAFYIQADEVVHEKYLETILEACKRHKDDKKIQGLLFNYLHFYGTYDYIGDSRKWYSREVRIIRNDKRISAYKDAQGFRIGKSKIKVKPIDAFIYHYGWVKSPVQMKRKILEVRQYWHEDATGYHPDYHANEIFDFNDFDSLKRFTGTHPAVMKTRVDNQHWKIDLDISKRSFNLKNSVLYWIEKKTGFRLFDFKNYKTI